ncbi:hypothetical protein Q5H92_21880 [Hymenobacter sp. M29]|uniref:Phage tail protein n=1 Tax=Hymenobacter mellowenesis TaxID=3063995 RepID=A0ABT9AGN4_9BACT|nr:hypothetical protein [Hymenobacter sp. M29]MDO7849030.1 hypothetical protein [Hymenobacter sp. M29]
MLYPVPSPANGVTLAGLRALLLAPWQAGATYSYLSAAKSTVTGFAGLTGWQRIEAPLDGSQFGEAISKGKNGRVSAQSISIVLAGLAAPQRTAVESLIEAGPIVALCQDFRLQWWLYGQDFGLVVPTVANTSGPFRGDSTQSIAISGTQRSAARLIAQSRINLLYNRATVFAQAPA